MSKPRDEDFTPAEAERVRSLLRQLRDERFGGVNAQLGAALGLTGQALSQSLRADHPTVPRFSTARKAAKLAGYSDVWEVLWPALRGSGAPRSNYEIAADVARREGWPDDVIFDLERDAAFHSERTPMHWIDQMRGRSLAKAPDVVAPKTRIVDEIEPATTFATFGERLKYLRSERGWTTKRLATVAKVSEGDVKSLEGGAKLGTPETIERLRVALQASARWLGSPFDSVTTAKPQSRRKQA